MMEYAVHTISSISIFSNDGAIKYWTLQFHCLYLPKCQCLALILSAQALYQTHCTESAKADTQISLKNITILENSKNNKYLVSQMQTSIAFQTQSTQ